MVFNKSTSNTTDMPISNTIFPKILQATVIWHSHRLNQVCQVRIEHDFFLSIPFLAQQGEVRCHVYQ